MIVSFLMGSGVLLAQSSEATVAKIVSINGKVSIKGKKDKAFKKAIVNAKLSGDTYIKTEAKSTASIVLVGGSLLSVKESSMVLVNDMLVKKDKGKNSIGVCFGSVDVAVKKLSKDESLNVMSPSAVLGVRGTKFEVTTLPDGSSVVKVQEGVVQCDGEKSSATLKENENAAANFYDDELQSNIDIDKFTVAQNDFLKKSPDKVIEKMAGKMDEIANDTEKLSQDVKEENLEESSDEYRKNKNFMAGLSENAKNIWKTNPTDKVVKMYYQRAKAIDARYAEISKMIEDRLQRVDQLYKERADNIEKKYQESGKKLDNIDEKMKAIDEKLKKADEKLNPPK